jgi:hypothetical protein
VEVNVAKPQVEEVAVAVAVAAVAVVVVEVEAAEVEEEEHQPPLPLQSETTHLAMDSKDPRPPSLLETEHNSIDSTKSGACIKDKIVRVTIWRSPTIES